MVIDRYYKRDLKRKLFMKMKVEEIKNLIIF